MAKKLEVASGVVLLSSAIAMWWIAVTDGQERWPNWLMYASAAVLTLAGVLLIGMAIQDGRSTGKQQPVDGQPGGP